MMDRASAEAPQAGQEGANAPAYVPADSHYVQIAALEYRGVMCCRSCVLPEEVQMAGRFHGWDGVRGSGWRCDRCGIELECQRPEGWEAAITAMMESGGRGSTNTTRELCERWLEAALPHLVAAAPGPLPHAAGAQGPLKEGPDV